MERSWIEEVGRAKPERIRRQPEEWRREQRNFSSNLRSSARVGTPGRGRQNPKRRGPPWPPKVLCLTQSRIRSPSSSTKGSPLVSDSGGRGTEKDRAGGVRRSDSDFCAQRSFRNPSDARGPPFGPLATRATRATWNRCSGRTKISRPPRQRGPAAESLLRRKPRPKEACRYLHLSTLKGPHRREDLYGPIPSDQREDTLLGLDGTKHGW